MCCFPGPVRHREPPCSFEAAERGWFSVDFSVFSDDRGKVVQRQGSNRGDNWASIPEDGQEATPMIKKRTPLYEKNHNLQLWSSRTRMFSADFPFFRMIGATCCASPGNRGFPHRNKFLWWFKLLQTNFPHESACPFMVTTGRRARSASTLWVLLLL